MGNIVWLVSYPKSGNTWYRIFLTNLISSNDKPASINNLKKTPISSARHMFEESTGLDSSNFSFNEIDNIRPCIYKNISDNKNKDFFIKVHDAYIINKKKKPVFPKEASKGIIYFLRNPLDVVVSYAHHSGVSYDKTIKLMNNNKYSLCGTKNKLHNQLRQQLTNWSSHPISWIENDQIPICLIRYEDMHLDSINTFYKTIKFLNLDYNRKDVEKALELSDFEKLKEQEQKQGFREKPQNAESFFRKGKIGSWREELTKKQIIKIINNHSKAMRRFGYLDNNDQLIF